MMRTNENAEVLNELISVNNDRAVGYEKVVIKMGQGDKALNSIFKSLALESNTYVNELSRYIIYSGGTLRNNTATGGKLYNSWVTTKAIFSGEDKKSILKACEEIEDAVQKTYKLALEADSENRLTAEAKYTIEKQKDKLKISCDRIRLLRETQPS